MRLTSELAGRVASPVDDPGPLPGTSVLSEADYEAAVRSMLADHPSTRDIWVFAYGSLIWKPACDFVEQRIGIARGWHRSFCLGWDMRFRGSRRAPGLMLSLDRGGQCKGVAYRLPPEAVQPNLDRLVRRELRVKPTAHSPRWIMIDAGDRQLRAIAFVIDRKGGRYVRGLSLEEIADALAVAAGHWGSMAEYLHSTVKHLEALGIHDRRLWRLQELVAERIEAAGEHEVSVPRTS